MDRTAIDRAYSGSGSDPYDPKVLLKMVVYQYLKGNQSPATWCEEAKFNKAMEWLGRGYVPARRTWYDFRNRIGKFIEFVHQQVITDALETNIFDPTVGVQDGTSVAACASRHRTVNRPTLVKRTRQLGKILNGEFRGKLPTWVPATESGKLDLVERMKEASYVLSKRISRNAKRSSDKRKDPDKIQVSLSDPVAPLGRDKKKVFRPLYTVQFVVARTSYLIMSYMCEPEVTDTGTLHRMIDKTQGIVGGRLKTMMADSAYCSILDLRDCRERGVELIAPVQANSFTEAKKVNPPKQIPKEEFKRNKKEDYYLCPAGNRLKHAGRSRRQRHGDRQLWEHRYRCNPKLCAECPLKKKCLRPKTAARIIKRLEGSELLDQQRKKMTRRKIQTLYRERSQTVELAFADCKGNRRLDRYHGRGLQRAQTETGIMVLAQNILRVDRIQRKLSNPQKIQT